MKVAITGSTGLVGKKIDAGLKADGHQVVKLVRGKPIDTDEFSLGSEFRKNR